MTAMPLERQRNMNPDLAELGANLAGFIGALAGTAASIARGLVVRPLADRLTGGSLQDGPGHEAPYVESGCGCGVVRHHYRVCCVPPRYGCPR
jgi:hypothetical protein